MGSPKRQTSAAIPPGAFVLLRCHWLRMVSEEGASSAACIAAPHLGFGPIAWSETWWPCNLAEHFPLSFLLLDRLLLHVGSNYHPKTEATGGCIFWIQLLYIIFVSVCSSNCYPNCRGKRTATWPSIKHIRGKHYLLGIEVGTPHKLLYFVLYDPHHEGEEK